MGVANTKRGVKITATATDASVVVLLQEHAKAVTGSINKGAEGMPERHPVPSRQ